MSRIPTWGLILSPAVPVPTGDILVSPTPGEPVPHCPQGGDRATGMVPSATSTPKCPLFGDSFTVRTGGARALGDGASRTPEFTGWGAGDGGWWHGGLGTRGHDGGETEAGAGGHPLGAVAHQGQGPGMGFGGPGVGDKGWTLGTGNKGWGQGMGSGDLGLGTRGWGLGIRDLGDCGWGTRLVVRGQGTGDLGDQGPEIKVWGLGTGDLKLGTRNWKSGTKNWEWGTGGWTCPSPGGCSGLGG